MNKNYKQGYNDAIAILFPRLDEVRQTKNPKGKCGANEYLVIPEDGRKPFCRQYSKNNTGRNLAIAGGAGALLGVGALALMGKGKDKGTPLKKERQSTSETSNEATRSVNQLQGVNEVVPTKRVGDIPPIPPPPEKPPTAKTIISRPKKPKTEEEKPPVQEAKTNETHPLTEGKKTSTPKQEQETIADPWSAEKEPTAPTQSTKKEEVKAPTVIKPDPPNAKTVNKPVRINSNKVAEALAKNGIEGDMSAYDVITTAPHLRVYNKTGQIDSNATREMIKARGKNTDHFEQEIQSLNPRSGKGREVSEFVKRMEDETGLKMYPDPKFLHFRTEEGLEELRQSPVHYKGHFNLKDLSKLNRDDIVEIGKRLTADGYKGDFKINADPQDAKSHYDLFTMHSTDPEQIKKAEKIVQDYFGDNIEYMGRGVDKNPFNPKATNKESGRKWRSFNQINEAIANGELKPDVFTSEELDFIERRTSKVSQQSTQVKQNKGKQLTIVKPKAREEAIKEISNMDETVDVPKEWIKDGKRLEAKEIEQQIMDFFNTHGQLTPSSDGKVRLPPIQIPPSVKGKRNYLPTIRAYRSLAESLGYDLQNKGYEDYMQKGSLHIILNPQNKATK